MTNKENQIPCAGIIVLAKNQSTILVKTKQNNYSFPKGKRKKGETYFQTASREFCEETGIKMDQIEILCDSDGKRVYVDELSDRNNPNIRYFVGTLLVDANNIKMSCDPDELEIVEWIDKNTLFNLEKLKPQRKTVFTNVLALAGSLFKI